MESNYINTRGGTEPMYIFPNRLPESARAAILPESQQNASTEIERTVDTPHINTAEYFPHAAVFAQTMPVRCTTLAPVTQDARRKRSLGHSDGSERPAGTRAHPIDLTSSPPRLDSRTGLGFRDGSRVCIQDSGRFGADSRPVWQPDEEASTCPICSEHFTWYFRKHHCRKCGRVVCANCSQHRVTMALQSIVQAPDETYSGQTYAANSKPFSLDGAETVRVCNPCVPDPNFSPLTRPVDRLGRYVSHGQQSTAQPSDVASLGVRSQAYLPPLYESSSSRHIPSANSIYHSVTSPAPSHRTTHSSSVFPTYSSLAAFPAPHSRPSQRRATLSSTPAPSQLHLANPSTREPQRLDSRTIGSSDLSTPVQAYRERPQLAEEDECPVCGNELPSRNASDDDAARARHVEQCISSYGSFRRQPFRLQSAVTTSAPFTPIFDPSLTAGPSTIDPGLDYTPMVLSEFAGPSAASAASSDLGILATPPLPHIQSALAPHRRAARMLEYRASEKDCVDDRGEEQECIICFEEFAVGDDLGRLECLCKFHKGCILGWWRAKESANHGSRSPSGCPTHVLQI